MNELRGMPRWVRNWSGRGKSYGSRMKGEMSWLAAHPRLGWEHRILSPSFGGMTLTYIVLLSAL